MTQKEKVARAAKFNDEFRRRGCFGTVHVSEKIQARGSVFVTTAKHMVAADDNHTPETDPTGRHDFGIVKVDDVSVCWKIDYLRDLDDNPYQPVDPACAISTMRMLTIFTPLEH